MLENVEGMLSRHGKVDGFICCKVLGIVHLAKKVGQTFGATMGVDEGR